MMNATDGAMEYREFMRLSDEEVSSVVKQNGAPTSVCVVDDATRRTGQVFFGLDINDAEFISKLNRRLSRPYQRIFSSCFRQGVDTLFVPAMTYGCYNRGDVYHHKIMEFAREVFIDGCNALRAEGDMPADKKEIIERRKRELSG